MTKKKLLLAEDDQDDRMLFADFIKDRNDFVLVASCDNGVELMQFLDNLQNDEDLPDLILLDQNMPKMNGNQTVEALKNIARYAHLPVAIYTTYPDKKLVADSNQLGVVAVVTKPISYTGYKEMMDELSTLIGG